MKKPVFVSIDTWNDIDIDDREHVLQTAAMLLRYGYLHEEAFQIACEIQQSRNSIKQIGDKFSFHYEAWVSAGLSPQGNDLEQSVIIGKILSSINEALEKHRENILASEDPIRGAWKHTKWQIPDNYCLCCMRKIDDKSLDKKRIAGLNLHDACSNKFAGLAKAISTTIVDLARSDYMTEQPVYSPEIQQTPEVIYEAVETPSFLHQAGLVSG